MSPHSERHHSIRRVLAWILVLNWSVAAVKIALGAITGSLSVLSDGFHSLLDGASNIIGLVAIGVAHRPPDANHPYGHRKFEALAAMAICTLLALTCWEILQSVFARLRGGIPALEVTPLAVGVLAGTIAVNMWVAAHERRRGRELQSPLLTADAAHTLSDVCASFVALGSMVAAMLDLPWVDLVAAVIIVGFIVRVGHAIVVENLGTLTDAARLDPAEVIAETMRVAGVLRASDVRSRGSQDAVLVEIIVDVAPDITAAETERIEHEIEDSLRSRWPQVLEVRVHHHAEGSGIRR